MRSHDQTGDRVRNAAQRRRLEPLRDQIFAACGYAFAASALIVELLTPHIGRYTLIAGIALAIVLIPINVTLIRRFARLRRSPTAQRTNRPTGQHEADPPPPRAPQP